MIAETAKVAASTANAGAEPADATRRPPSTGPASEPAWTIAEDSALLAASWPGLSSAGMIVKDAGRNSPSPAPSSAATGASSGSEASRCEASTTSAVTSTHRAASAASMMVRAPILSARIPPTGIRTVRGTP